MAAMWSDGTFGFTSEDARAAYRPDGGWWYTDDIDDYLNDHAIPHYFIGLGYNALSTWDIVTQELDAGNICILCLDMYYIRATQNRQWRVDKFYSTNGKDWGHFIVAKGYKLVDGKRYFEVYDPFSWDKTYEDGTFKGKDRYYRNVDIYKATSVWWNHTIVVMAKGSKSAAKDALNPASIPHQRGR
jgi:hypothetical protein